MPIAAIGARYEKVIIFVVACLAVLGAFAYVSIPASIFPTMSFSRIDVVADAANLPPDQVRTAISLPLERAFQGLPSVTRVRTISEQGNAEWIVEFDPSTNVQGDLTYVNQTIAQTSSVLPPNVNVQANVISPNSEPVISYALTSSDMSQTLLHELATNSMVPRFYGASGLARVSAAGGPLREFRVTLSPGSLAVYGLSPDDVSQAIAQASTVTPVGVQVQHYVRNVVVVDAALRDEHDLERVMVPTAKHDGVPIAALGAVSVGVAPAIDEVSFDATRAVILSFYALPGADAARMAREVAQRAATIGATLPAGAKLTKAWDQSVLVDESQKSLRDAILVGALLAIGVIFLFLRNLRMTLVAAIVIPIAMLIAIFALGRAGQTLNLMSVGALAIAVGLIIDDTIVVIENIARNHHERPNTTLAEVVYLSMAQIGGPMIASTATTVVVFIPLALLSGVSGFFFRALALTLGSALIVSLGLALFLAPVLAKHLVRESDQDHEGHNDPIGRVLAGYEPLLRLALRRRSLVYAASAVVLAVTVALLALLPSDFLPKLDEGQFEISYVLPVGTSLDAADAAAQRMEAVVMRDPAVLTIARWSAVDTNGYSPIPANAGVMRVQLKPAGERTSYERVSDRLRDALGDAVPAAQLDFHQILEDMINDVSGAPAPLEISLQGTDQATLAKFANVLAGNLSKVPGLTDVFSGVVYTDPTIRLSPNDRRLASLGLLPSSLATAISAETQGSVAANLPGPSNLVPVRVSVAGLAPSLEDANIATSSGPVSLTSLAALGPAQLSTTIYENNGQRELRTTATIAGANLSTVVDGARKAIAEMHLPPGYRAEIGGEYAAQQSSFREFVAVISIAVLLVFGVMLATFHSFRLPLVILTAIPLALIGVALGLFLTRTPFNVSSFMGLLLLVGIVVKNGILLIDVANQRRIAGDSIEDALVAAGRTRLRPIVMTTFAAIGGLLPLALGIGSGAAMEKPLAIAVIGGLSTATAFTLIVIPVLYAGIAGKRTRS